VDLYLATPANARRAFDVLFEGCAADAACNAAYPDLRSVFFATVERLNAQPARFQVTHALSGQSYPVLMDGNSWVGVVFQMLYDSDVVPALPQLIYQASQGDFDLVALILGALLAMRRS
jgi:hypothetical protein